MNLGMLTPAQRDCVTHVDGPLLVSAGAGSGKTLMLTQRIAYALLHPELSGVGDVGQVLAITFTDPAAGEIKARVRSTLREEGLTGQALKVDASWIGTIHGMCSRILHESALDLGLDPQFTMLDETDRAQLLEASVNAALAEAGAQAPDAEGGEDGGAVIPRYRELFREYEKADGPSNVGAMAAALVNCAANVRGGLDAVSFAPVPPAREVARDVQAAMEACDAVAREGIGANGKAKETFTVRARDALEDPLAGMPAFERLAARAGCSYEEVAEALMRADLGFGSHTTKEPYATAYAVLRAEAQRACTTCALGIAARPRGELMALARRVQELFDGAKASMGALDQNDLLLKALAALEGRPEVEARYRDRFRLVMVDEFQDTSGIQIALISRLSGGGARLCTVGDTQQSIYRFRGADVETYRRHKREMRALERKGGMSRELDVNFRSHGDIIAFVNRVFGDPEVFGEGGEFIRLTALPEHAAKNPFPDVPRVDVVATTSAHASKVTVEDRHLVEAEAVARRLEALHADEENRRWGDMVVLLGTMARSDMYASTLRAHGIPCVVTGGSGFSWTPEAQEVGALLGAVADPWDDTNLRAALSGSAFGLGAEELLRLGSAPGGGRRHLWEGLLDSSAGDPSARVRLAGALLTDAVARAGARGAEATLTDLAVSSGWLARLQGQGPQGMASAANVLKAVRLADTIEREGGAARGIPATAARLALKLAEGMKEKPGSLMVKGQDAVRVMTIHASKGLEFPVVALADFYGLRAERDRLRLETVGDDVRLSLMPSASVAKGTELERLLDAKLTPAQAARLREAGRFDLLAAPELDEARDAYEMDRAIRAHNAAEELGELRRKFYVGATRAREALVVAVNMSVSKTAGNRHGDVLDDLRRALFGEAGDFVTAPEGIDFGGERRAAAERIELSLGDDQSLLVNGRPASEFLRPEMARPDGQAGAGAAGAGAVGAGTAGAGAAALDEVPEAPRPGERLADLVPGRRPCDPLRAGTFSYSSIAPEPSGAGAPGAAAARADGGGTGTGAGMGGAGVGVVGAGGPAAPAEEERDPDEPGALGASLGEEAPAGGDDMAEEARRRRERATAFGSALHEACQLMAEDLAARRSAGQAGGVLEPPGPERVAACMRRWGVAEDRRAALEEALARWAGSDAARESAARPDAVPEAPFLVTLLGAQGEPIRLTGSIDLLCHDRAAPAGAQEALVIDYKTGGLDSEGPEELRRKHALQAACYAYAVLSGGYASVDLRFVRVQRPDPADPSQPQVVRYRYEARDLQALAETVRAAYAASRERGA